MLFRSERDEVIGKLLECAVIPPLDIDEALRFEQRKVEPKLGLRLTQKHAWNEAYFEGKLLLDYGRGWSESTPGSGGVWVAEERLYLMRDLQAEDRARAALVEFGLRLTDETSGAWRIAPKAMPRAVRELVHAGWHVEAEGKAFRRPGESRVDVRSGIDWFELHAEVDYGDGASASLPQLDRKSVV